MPIRCRAPDDPHARAAKPVPLAFGYADSMNEHNALVELSCAAQLPQFAARDRVDAFGAMHNEWPVDRRAAVALAPVRVIERMSPAESRVHKKRKLGVTEKGMRRVVMANSRHAAEQIANDAG